jgi:hypothetical protein
MIKLAFTTKQLNPGAKDRQDRNYQSDYNSEPWSNILTTPSMPQHVDVAK